MFEASTLGGGLIAIALTTQLLCSVKEVTDEYVCVKPTNGIVLCRNKLNNSFCSMECSLRSMVEMSKQ